MNEQADLRVLKIYPYIPIHFNWQQKLFCNLTRVISYAILSLGHITAVTIYSSLVSSKGEPQIFIVGYRCTPRYPQSSIGVHKIFTVEYSCTPDFHSRIRCTPDFYSRV